ncbi:DUF6779 domain-containing protein [Actinomycetospora termitidis]|uniref:DUF6779 domain-containing protein n=1 Tax=Actinomycetospora termitidis TaxID=3053470 RepID=A0ABT7MAH2_9PSEU|nr:DUF6779 domain-containing protein [Actinomycetospora sp. Odt1-22]MDL5157658.1 hypothetical protein [Actinomycetospora sp. Odt1-22]
MAAPGPDRRRGSRSSPAAGGGRPGDPVVRVLLGATAVCAALAAGTVVLADDPRMLRLGVVAGLWAALLAVAALARRSGQGGEAAERELESMRRTYELELNAEIDARREHELTVEQSVRREVAAEAGQEMAGLRAEVERLRSHLENAETRAVTPAPPLQVVASEGRRRPAPPPRPEVPAAPDPPRLPRQHVNEISHPSAPGRGTGGRTVAELLAAHAEDRRRRPPR